MTHPTDDLDALISPLISRLRLHRKVGEETDDAFAARMKLDHIDAIAAITSLRAQLAEAEVFDFPDRKAMSKRISEQRKLIRKLQIESDTRLRILMEANARADRAEAERATQIEADAGIAYKCLYPKNDQSDWTNYARQHAADAIEVRQAILSQPHDRTALDRVKAEVRADAIREAADKLKGQGYNTAVRQILALIDKEGE